ncbi:hypothetical protein OG21DRAFT_1510716 [Imleria badia]|nr:hypothetical protein OG21DRAFT_1510716 [Imleria badia]
MTLRRGGAVVLSLSLSFPPRPHLLGMTRQRRQRDDAAAQSSSPSPFLLLVPTYLGMMMMTPTRTLGGGWQPVPGMGAGIIAGTRGYTRATA